MIKKSMPLMIAIAFVISGFALANIPASPTSGDLAGGATPTPRRTVSPTATPTPTPTPVPTAPPDEPPNPTPTLTPFPSPTPTIRPS